MNTLFFLLAKLIGLSLRIETWIALLLLTTWIALKRENTRLARRGLGTAFLLMLTIGFLPVGDLLLRPLEQRFAVNPDLRRVDGIVILGGSENSTLSRHWGQPSLNGSAERYVMATMLALQHPEARVLFTGGSGAVFARAEREVSVAEELLIGLGISRERLLLEGTARNTAENASAAWALAQPEAGEAWILVTSASHMPRAIGAFCLAGWSVLPYPVDFRTGRFAEGIGWDLSGHLGGLNRGIKEWFGLLAYWATGRTNAVLPGGCEAAKT